MKKRLIISLAFLICIIALICGSCFAMNLFSKEQENPDTDINKNIESTDKATEETATQTEELRKFADPALISKLKNGMNTEEVKSILGASPIELGNNIDTFMFTDGRVVYVSKGSGGSLEYDNSIAPDLVNQIKIGDSYSDVTQKLRANGVQPYNRYGCIGYCLSDGRKLHIEFTPDNFVESFSVSDH